MPKGLQITIYVLIGIAVVWVLLLILDVIFVSSFLTILKKHRHAMTVILNTKYENLKKVFNIMDQYGVEIDNKLLCNLNDINVSIFNDVDSKECEAVRGTLSYLKDEIMFIANQHEELNQEKDFLFAKNNVLEADVIYRSNVAMYNADILGYNYWISFFPCKFIFKLLKFKKKEIIS